MKIENIAEINSAWIDSSCCLAVSFLLLSFFLLVFVYFCFLVQIILFALRINVFFGLERAEWLYNFEAILDIPSMETF